MGQRQSWEWQREVKRQLQLSGLQIDVQGLQHYWCSNLRMIPWPWYLCTPANRSWSIVRTLRIDLGEKFKIHLFVPSWSVSAQPSHLERFSGIFQRSSRSIGQSSSQELTAFGSPCRGGVWEFLLQWRSDPQTFSKDPCAFLSTCRTTRRNVCSFLASYQVLKLFLKFP